MAEPFDIAVVGAGPAGYVAALRAAGHGARVAIAEKHLLGGTCLNYGCIPSKALLATGERIQQIREAGELGVKISGEPQVDWPAVQKRKDRVLKTLRGGIGQLFKARNVALYEGTARLDGPGTLAVTAADGQVSPVSARQILLCPGSTPVRIPGWPEDPERVCTSDESLHWKTLPESLLIVGGGVIGCEFACMMHAMGVKVTVVEMLPGLLPNMEPCLGEQIAKTFRGRGMEIHVDTRVEEMGLTDTGVRAKISGGREILAERVLVSVGRRPVIDALGLETVGLTSERGFLRVDERMATTAAGIWCAGDATGRQLLAHAGSAQGEVAADNALGHERRYDSPIPEAVYTFPEVAAVGLTSRAARERNIPVSVGVFPIGHLGKAMAVGHTEGFVKVLRRRDSGELLGVHMLGHNVTEIVAAATGLLHQKVSVAEVAETVFAHPTISESLKEAAADAIGEAIHLPPRKVVRLRG
jgi:dihydrolipoamide dehydrogenase